MGKRAGQVHGRSVCAVRRVFAHDGCVAGRRAADERQHGEWHVLAQHRCERQGRGVPRHSLPGAGDRRAGHVTHRRGRRLLDVSRPHIRRGHSGHHRPARRAAADHRRDHERWRGVRPAARRGRAPEQPAGAGAGCASAHRLHARHCDAQLRRYCELPHDHGPRRSGVRRQRRIGEPAVRCDARPAPRRMVPLRRETPR
ncbi:MAG: hypothetical protein DMD59_10115 [Gemmatimonadetes bacterium]|nr:MAG: hypothetical protein DMD59_10115 [Gemmatimonadota bacterium]